MWPHDNTFAAAGFRSYGIDEGVHLVARGLFDAAAHFASHRLPELFAGLQRDPGSFPVQYLGANVPQAWASGAVTHLLATLMGLEADAAGASTPRSASLARLAARSVSAKPRRGQGQSGFADRSTFVRAPRARSPTNPRRPPRGRHRGVVHRRVAVSSSLKDRHLLTLSGHLRSIGLRARRRRLWLDGRRVGNRRDHTR